MIKQFHERTHHHTVSEATGVRQWSARLSKGQHARHDNAVQPRDRRLLSMGTTA